MKKYLSAINLFKIGVLFLVIDYFAFQKELPIFWKWLLIVMPSFLFAATCFIWAYNRQFPFPDSPFFPYLDISGESSKIFRAVILGIFFALFGIIITASYFSAW